MKIENLIGRWDGELSKLDPISGDIVIEKITMFLKEDGTGESNLIYKVNQSASENFNWHLFNEILILDTKLNGKYYSIILMALALDSQKMSFYYTGRVELTKK